MKFREQMSRWWFDFHQRGVFMHCTGAFGWCFADNLFHTVLRRPLQREDENGDYAGDYWICRMHDERIGEAARRKEFGRRARQIRALGWGR